MTEHASDCGLHNAPARPPEPCSCGASQLFKVFGYDVTQDGFRFTVHCRESFVANIISAALAGAYGDQKVVRYSTLIRRALADGLTPNEAEVIATRWRERSVSDPGMATRFGICDTFTKIDGSPLSDEQRAAIVAEPDIAEMRSVMAPWFDWWGTMKEPSLTGTRFAPMVAA